MMPKIEQSIPLCECGCGGQVKLGCNGNWNRFIHGHTNKNRNLTKDYKKNIGLQIIKKRMLRLEKQLCECGCGEYAKLGKRFIHGHSIKGKKLSKEICKKIGNRFYPTGENHHNWGKKVSNKTKQKISTSLFGRKIPLEVIEKMSKSSIGKIRSKKTRDKMSKAKKGQKFSKEHCRKISMGKKGISLNLSTEQRLHRSLIKSGENNPSWKGGISCEPYCPEFTQDLKEFIKERDNYECQNPDCNKITNKFGIHHIDYNKKHCLPSNLITLCNSCNSRVNGNRDYWSILYKGILNEIYNEGSNNSA